MLDEPALELKQTMNLTGYQISCLLEAASSTPPETPLIIVVPPYSKTMRELLVTSMYMSYNGFRACRFDFSNHVGISEGRIFDFTLSSAIEDLRAVIESVRSWYPEARMGVISSSLGSRVALRALRDRSDVRALVSLVGVVNLRATLSRILGRDFIGDYVGGQPLPDSREVLGYEIGRRFLVDLVERDAFSLESAKEDLRACPFPVVEILAEADTWTEVHDVEEVFRSSSSSAPRQAYVLPHTSHKLENNPSAARLALSLAVVILKRELLGESLECDDVISPSFPEIVRRNRVERGIERSVTIRNNLEGESVPVQPRASALDSSASLKMQPARSSG